MADLALDIGQTQTRVRLVDSPGATEEIELDGFRYGSDIVETVRQRCEAAAQAFGVKAVRAIAGGVTGLYGRAPEPADLLRSLHRTLGVERVVIADDAVTSHLGALEGRPGVLIAAGTGIVGLGIGPAGVARVDGVGSLIGDEGSGWWIGRRGIIAALSAYDGRAGGSAALLSAMEEQYGPAADVAAAIAGSASPVGLVASFAPAVAAAARAGDRTAGLIWAEAASHLADAVIAAGSRAGYASDSTFDWAVSGRLTGASDLLDPVLDRLVAERFPRAGRVPPHGNALDGAERLLRYTNLRALFPLVGVSVIEKDTDD
ncbi:ATPase [Leifsonia sp. ku-ls]|nr:ATPase [Leifsonia sp. ku-ls]